jgi:hypothetical protein
MSMWVGDDHDDLTDGGELAVIKVDPRDRLEVLADEMANVPGRVCVPWPSPQSPASMRNFETAQEWREALSALDLEPTCPAPMSVRAKFRRAQKLYLLAWIDGDVMLAGEMAAFTTIELALNDRFGGEVWALLHPKGKARKVSATATLSTPPLSDLLDYLVTHAGIQESDFPTALVGGGQVVDRLRKVGPKASRPTLYEYRNRLAHGDPFEGLPLGGLLHVTRDLIHFIYR